MKTKQLKQDISNQQESGSVLKTHTSHYMNVDECRRVTRQV